MNMKTKNFIKICRAVLLSIIMYRISIYYIKQINILNLSTLLLFIIIILIHSQLIITIFNIVRTMRKYIKERH